MNSPQIFNVIKYVFGSHKPITGPLKVDWEITTRCNLRCRTCSRWIKKPEGELTTKEAKRVIGELKDTNVRNISFTGGEPLIRKDIFELISYTTSQGLNASINNNGSLITDKTAKLLVDSGVKVIFFSLDGSKKETHDYIRGVEGSFDKVLDAVKLVNKYRKPDQSLQLNMTINEYNKNEIIGAVELAKKIGVDAITMQPAHCFTGTEWNVEPEMMLSTNSADTVMEQIRDAMKKYPGFLPHPPEYYEMIEVFLKNPEKLYEIRCASGYLQALIDPEGELYACPAFMESMGNLKEKSFKEIWFSPDAEVIREKIKKGKHPICWFNCSGPVNIFLHQLSPLRIHRIIFNPNFIRYVIKRIR